MFDNNYQVKLKSGKLSPASLKKVIKLAVEVDKALKNTSQVTQNEILNSLAGILLMKIKINDSLGGSGSKSKGKKK